jgi:sugar/nucleoside kinase (ribokinase family)
MSPVHISPRRPLDVVVAGLAVVDVIGRPVKFSRNLRRGSLQYLDTIMLTTGGNVLNCGVDLVKLGFRVGAITRVGDDSFGRYIRSQISQYGINARGVIVDRKRQTSATIVCVDRTGERTFYHTRGCLENFRAKDVLARLDLVRKAKIFVFGYLGLLPEFVPEMEKLFAAIKRDTGVNILLDTGGTPTRSPGLLRKVLPYVDYFLPSLEEAAALTGVATPREIVESFRSCGAKGVVGVKLGAKGCFVSWQDRQEFIPALKVKKVIDATGAGDAFVSGFLAGVLSGLEPFEAARVGNAVAASCVAAVGASTAIQPLHSYLSKQ